MDDIHSRTRQPWGPWGRWGLVSACLLALTGCATTVPTTIQQAPEADLQVASVRAEPQHHAGQPVRWGGEIARVENRADVTRLEIVSRPLARGGRPRVTDETQGRFVAQVDGFLDPVVYAPGREVTLAGPVAGVEDGRIGEYDYRFPRVTVREIYLWSPREEGVRDPYRYPPPFYDPWYPFYAPFHRPWPY